MKTGKKPIWLVWEIQIVKIENFKVQLQNLRVIADTEENGNLYKLIFEKELEDRNLDKSIFIVEKREINHMLGWEDLRKYVSQDRSD